ncbi:MAG TPA: hypothetical protein VHG91_19160 [Longimicrobium sp.]|nr:hypothetical protein [Longimicrobium sp.]
MKHRAFAAVLSGVLSLAGCSTPATAVDDRDAASIPTLSTADTTATGRDGGAATAEDGGNMMGGGR